ncbi:MAG: hypothetical protein ACE5OQ_08915 [Woeseia sp.]
MKQSDPLQLQEEGSLEPPGPIGRLTRLTLGLACLYGLYELILYHQNIIQTPVSVLPNLVIMVFAAVFITNYVVNIGLGRSWGRWPSYVLVGASVLLATVAWLTFGTPDHPMFGAVLWAWLVYFFAHLGMSFVLAAVLATPGCEMRSIPQLFGKITGRRVAEHHCPAAFIAKIDNWESKRA